MANTNIERTNIVSVDVTSSQKSMVTNFVNMLNSVTNMLNTEGPIYTTWIRFQLGEDNSNPLIFDSSSTDNKKNLIAQLEMEKSGAGITNSFTLVVQYDPFNMGQESKDTIEKMDEYVAMALSANFGDSKKTLIGYIQYGYNSVSDASLVSPKYTFYLTGATNEVKFESGLSTYTFTGTSIIAADCDNVTNFEEVHDKKLMELIEETLYYWYGTAEKPAPHVGNSITPSDNEYKYSINIEDDLYNDSVTIDTYPAQSKITPWNYCQNIFYEYPLTQSEQDSDMYSNLPAMNFALRPRYIMYVDDGNKSIRITHIVPKVVKVDEEGNPINVEYSEASLLTSNYTFFWGQQSQNLVIGWRPEVDTMLYLIRRARYIRAKATLDKAQDNYDKGEPGSYKALVDAKKELTEVNGALNEMYDAQLQIVGIPADPPLGMEIGIMPTILESISRTAGVYQVTGCSDVISSNGTYVSTLKLLRIRDFDDKTIKLEASNDINTQAQEDNNASKSDDDVLVVRLTE